MKCLNPASRNTAGMTVMSSGARLRATVALLAKERVSLARVAHSRATIIAHKNSKPSFLVQAAKQAARPARASSPETGVR